MSPLELETAVLLGQHGEVEQLINAIALIGLEDVQSLRDNLAPPHSAQRSTPRMSSQRLRPQLDWAEDPQDLRPLAFLAVSWMHLNLGCLAVCK